MDEIQVVEYIKEFKEQNFENFSIFYEALKRDVFYNILGIVANKEDAEDILQETFVTFLSNIDKVKLHGAPLGYLFKISYNLAQDYHRKKSKVSELDPLQEERITADEKDESSLTELMSKISLLLSKKEYQIFILKALHDYSHQEIAKILNRPLGTITWSYQQAVKKLKKGLGTAYEW